MTSPSTLARGAAARTMEHWSNEGDGPYLLYKHSLDGACKYCTAGELIAMLRAVLSPAARGGDAAE